MKVTKYIGRSAAASILAAATLLTATGCGEKENFFKSLQTGMSIENYDFMGELHMESDGTRAELYYNGTVLASGRARVQVELNYIPIEVDAETAAAVEDAGIIASVPMMTATGGRVHFLDLYFVDDALYIHMPTLKDGLAAIGMGDLATTFLDMIPNEWLKLTADTANTAASLTGGENAGTAVDATAAAKDVGTLTPAAQSLITKTLAALEPKITAIEPSLLTSSGTQHKLTVTKDSLGALLTVLEDFVANDAKGILEACAKECEKTDAEAAEALNGYVADYATISESWQDMLKSMREGMEAAETFEGSLTTAVTGKNNERVWNTSLSGKCVTKVADAADATADGEQKTETTMQVIQMSNTIKEVPSSTVIDAPPAEKVSTLDDVLGAFGSLGTGQNALGSLDITLPDKKTGDMQGIPTAEAKPAVENAVLHLLENMTIDAELVPISKEHMMYYAEIDMENVSDFALYVCGDGVSADEVGVFVADTEADAALVKQALNARVAQRKELFAHESEAELTKLENCLVECDGCTVYYVVATDSAKAVQFLK